MSAANRGAALTVAGPQRHALAILALPIMNTVVIPAAILETFGGGALASVSSGSRVVALGIAVGCIAFGAGVILVVTSIGLFASRGEGTLAPWDPPRKLVVAGPYRYVRNPMKAGLIFVLVAETLILRSPALGLWCAAFSIVNVAYIRVSEEPGLRRRFGESYAEYCANVPAWLPRFTPFAAHADRRMPLERSNP